MNKKEIQIIKDSILRCLTKDFHYGKTKKGTPLKRPRVNQAIFRLPEGFATFSETDLEMVMDAVVLGIYFAYEEINREWNTDG